MYCMCTVNYLCAGHVYKLMRSFDLTLPDCIHTWQERYHTYAVICWSGGIKDSSAPDGTKQVNESVDNGCG